MARPSPPSIVSVITGKTLKHRRFLIATLCLILGAHAFFLHLYVKNPHVSNIWAILIAGSKGWINYADQAMVCYAYHLLKSGGIEDDKIIVFMQDDIAEHANNDRQHFGSIYYEGRYTNDDGYEGTATDQGQYRKDVYEGVPKDYIGEFMTINNLKGVLYGDRSRVKGGSGKVLNSNSHDTIFFFFTGHGDGMYLEMGNEKLYKGQLAAMFQELQRRDKYKSVVAYISACFSGNIFSSLDALYKSMNIYVMTSSNETEISFRTLEDTFLKVSMGNYFDLAWIKDSWMHDRKNRSLEQQYEKVKEIVGRPSFHQRRSTVMQYGQKEITNEPLASYHGFTGRKKTSDGQGTN